MNQPMIIIDLVFNLALLVSVSVLSGFIDTRWRRTTTTGMVLQGLLFGLVAHLGMSNPFVYAPGLIFDGRSVVLSLCALFFGPYSGMIAGSIALIYRIMLGGPGEIMGVAVILYSTLVGVLCHYLVKSNRFKPTTPFLYCVGLVVHVGMVLLIFTLPAPFRSGTLKTLSITILGIYPIATALIGKILKDQADGIERKRAEELLFASEAKYRKDFSFLHSLIESPTDIIIFSVDKNYCYTAFTEFHKQTIKKIYGVDICLGKNILEVITNPMDYEKARMNFDRALGGECFVLIEEYGDPNRYRTYYENYYNCIKDATGQVIGVSLFVIDITQRKAAEESLKEMNAALELRVAERTRELENAMTELTARNQELQQFTYLSSHDIQEPLRTLSSFTHLLKEDYHSQLGPDGQKYIDFIHDSANRMRELVKGLLDYSFLGKEGVKEVVDCNQVVSDVLQDIEDLIKENNATITVSTLPTLFGYKTELRLLFQNLINNAIKFRKKNVSPVISITCEPSAQEKCFSIKDNGIGIEEKDREKIFIIFKRMHNRHEYEGTGIGLAHCKKIVELHQGKIWVEANNDGGSVFRFTISA